MSDAIPMPMNPASWPRLGGKAGRDGRYDKGEGSKDLSDRGGDGPAAGAGAEQQHSRPAEGPREDVAPKTAGAQAGFGGGEQEGEWVTVYIAFGPEEAHIVRQSLMVRDIPAIMRMDGLDTVVGTTLGRGVRVLVPRAMEDRARLVLEGDDLEGDAIDEPDDLA